MQITRLRIAFSRKKTNSKPIHLQQHPRTMAVDEPGENPNESFNRKGARKKLAKLPSKSKATNEDEASKSTKKKTRSKSKTPKVKNSPKDGKKKKNSQSTRRSKSRGRSPGRSRTLSPCDDSEGSDMTQNSHESAIDLLPNASVMMREMVPLRSTLKQSYSLSSSNKKSVHFSAKSDSDEILSMLQVYENQPLPSGESSSDEGMLHKYFTQSRDEVHPNKIIHIVDQAAKEKEPTSIEVALILQKNGINFGAISLTRKFIRQHRQEVLYEQKEILHAPKGDEAGRMRLARASIKFSCASAKVAATTALLDAYERMGIVLNE